MLGEHAGGSESQQPPTVSCLSHLAHRQVLQPEQLAGSARKPQAVNASPARVGVNSRSCSSLRRWATWMDTAASVTPRSAAAPLAEPCWTTAQNARSWVGVTGRCGADAGGYWTPHQRRGQPPQGERREQA